jgi:hypothetical protein
MIWTMTAIAAGLVVLAAVAMLALAGRRGRNRNGGSGSVATAGGPHGGFYGLSPEEAARFHQSVREHTQLHHVQWSRDYLPGAGTLPGRVAGIPRALRVRR